MSRLFWIDALKGWLMLLVVLGHAIQYCLAENTCQDNYLWNMIYSFHMPAFMALSGFVNYKKDYIDGWIIARRRCFQLLVPFVVWTIIKCIVDGNNLLTGLVNAFLKPDNSFWFLWVLWVLSMIFILNDELCKRINIKQEVGVCLIAILLVLSMVIFDIRIFGFQFISYYFLFYSIGYYMNKYKSHLFSSKLGTLSLFVGWFFLASFWNMHELPEFLNGITIIPQSILQYVYRFITAFFAVCLLIIVAPMVLNNENFLNNKTAHIGRISLGIYVTHLLIVVPISQSVCNLLSCNSKALIIIISFLMTLCLSVAIVWILSNNKYTSKYLLGKL